MILREFGLSGLILPLSVWLWAVPFVAAQESTNYPIPTALDDYVSRSEDVFEWKIADRQELEEGTLYDVDLTSQTWQGIVWKHVLRIHQPRKLDRPEHVLLFVTGGSIGHRPGKDDAAMGFNLAKLTGARVATLHHVPNQPLFDERYEDDLITETWLKYLETGDPNWPLLFPMVKSAVKAMDAVEAIAKSEWNGRVEGFVITGASKRGWTSWLTPTTDKRVIATAPIVIDVLNFRPQMKHQLDTWGEYSEQILDYTSKGLIKEGDETPREIQLRRMMDPYGYRRRLTLPKLLINGTNDPYWVVDAMNLYWYDLLGPKYVLQVPNAGHGLKGGHDLAFGTLAAFFRHVADGTEPPKLAWTNSAQDGHFTLSIESSSKPRAARLWIAHSQSKDLRQSNWVSQPLTEQGGRLVGTVPKPEQGHVAFYGELQFELDGLPYSLCTLVTRE
jgi:PhoPQ-activated pathogenicity-related protein